MRKVEGPTPNGGIYSEIYYFDEFDNTLENEENAVSAIAREIDKNGKVIKETKFYLKAKKENTQTKTL